MRLTSASLASVLFLHPVASNAASASPCGTVIVPTGLGMGVPAPVATLHPVLWTGSLYETELMNLLYRPLLWIGSGMAIDWTSSLADAVDVNADDTVFRVTLKPYRWSDGRPVTAEDVVYDWMLIKALGQTYSQYGQGGVPTLLRQVRAIDPLHVEFDLTRPANPEWFEVSGISQFYALPEQSWANDDLARQQSLQSETSFYRVVDGPFRLQDLQLGRYAAFVPNERYDGHKATIRRFVVVFLEGTDPLEALQAGQVDIANLPFELWHAASQLRGLRQVPMGASAVTGAILPNETNAADPFFDEVAVRQAIARAINQRQIVNTVFHGHATEQAGLIPSEMTAMVAPDLRHDQSPLSYDPEAARSLLDDAGWVVGTDGVRVKSGRRLAFTVLVTAADAPGLITLQLIQAGLARVGIAMAIKELEFNQLLARAVGPPDGWDAIYIDYTTATYPDPLQFFATGAYGNDEHYSNPTMDRLLARANENPGRDGLYAVEDYAVEQQPIFFLPDGAYTVLARPGIDGIHAFLTTNGMWSPEYLTLHGRLACR